jgi:tetratricopeptide (TPR) repeat protein
MAPSVQDQVFAPEVHMTKEPPEDCDMAIEETPEDCDTTIEEAPEDCDIMTEEPLHSESPKDLLNRFSHGLSPDSRYADLFAELDIEIAMESTKLRNLEEAVGEEQFISKSELHDLYRWNGHKVTYMEMCLVESSYRSQSSPSEMSSVRRTYHTARHRSAWSPLFEIDVFPVGVGVNRGTRKCTGPFWKSLIEEHKERKCQLLKLQQTLPISSPGIISILERLTSIAHNQDFFNLTPFEQLLKARLNEKAPSTYKILEATLRLIDYCVENSRYIYVAQFHKELHSRIRKHWPEDNSLHLQSSYSMAYILYLQGRYDKAEAMIRPVIRISLSKLGPYNDFTIKALQLLGRIMHHQNLDLVEEADRLLRLNVHILEQRALDITWWNTSDHLLRLLIKRGHYNESMSLSQHIMTYMEANLGMENLLVCQSRTDYARVLLKQGKISEAITFMKEARNKSEGILDSEEFLNSELALYFEENGDFQQAIVFHQKELICFVVFYKWEWTVDDILDVCRRIGYCYETLGRYNDAAAFYERVLGKLYSRKANSWSQKSIERVQRWLENLEQEESAGNEKRATNSKAVIGSMAEEHKSNDEGDPGVIDPDGEWEENINKGWDEIFGLEVRDMEFSVESLGLSEEFLKLDISQS